MRSRTDADKALEIPNIRQMLELDTRDARPALGFIDALPSVREIANQGVEYLIDGLLPEGQFGLLTGGFGAGKSMVALGMGNAVAKGKPFLERATKQRRVLILDQENPVATMAERMNFFDVDESLLKVWGGWNYPEPSQVDDPLVLEWCRDFKPLLIVDTLIRFHTGDESSSTDTAKIMGRLRRITATGASVLLLHHSGKGPSSSEYRGSSDIAGSVDVAFKLEKREGSTGLDGLILRAFKFRCAEQPEPITFRLGESEFIVTSDPTGQRNQENVAAVVECVKVDPGRSKAQLVESLRNGGMQRNVADRCVKLAQSRGLILAKPGARSGQVYLLPDVLEFTV